VPRDDFTNSASARAAATFHELVAEKLGQLSPADINAVLATAITIRAAREHRLISELLDEMLARARREEEAPPS
jgi:hypothetical protein